jgi:UPF0755 protein
MQVLNDGQFVESENGLYDLRLQDGATFFSSNIILKFAVCLKRMKKKIVLYLVSALAIVAFIVLFIVYRSLFGSSVKTEKSEQVIFIPTGSSYTQVLDTLKSNFSIKNQVVFEWLAKKKNYPTLVKPGKYIIHNNISCNELINLLRSGRQSPVKVTFNNVRSLNQLAGKIGKQIEADSTAIISFLNNESGYSSDGFNNETIISLFIPNTYDIYWNTDPLKLYNRMLKEYKLYWNEERMSKAREKNLTPVEVAILASIIDDEVVKLDEKPRIAGVYLNRLRKGIPLQACPTIKFALNDFTITRVLKKYLDVDSPYNTYKHNGFPPGPIGCPTISGLESVLNAEKHDYLFFAAKSDFSGYHNFSRTLSEHNHFAALYQKELDRRKIFK